MEINEIDIPKYVPNTNRTRWIPTSPICISDPEGIRTLDLRLRRPLLYPAELPNRVSFNFDGAKIALSRINTNIRTYFFRLK